MKNRRDVSGHFNESYGVAEIQITYRREYKISRRPQVKTSQDAYEILLDTWNETLCLRESFKVMFLNRGLKVLGIWEAFNGGIGDITVDTRLILATALKTGASGICISHNHPSGNLNPSDKDKLITEKLKSACEIMEIDLYDHIILTDENYFSFTDEGLL